MLGMVTCVHLLGQEGRRLGRKRVAGLMARMGIEALYRKPNTSRKKAGDQVYPYLLHDLTIHWRVYGVV